VIWTIFSTVVAILITVWLVATFGIVFLAVPLLLASSLAYVESGGNWIVFAPAALVIGAFMWIDTKIG
jgi:hypothetical protein